MQRKRCGNGHYGTLKGGQLANLPDSINQLWHEDEDKRKPVLRALKWAANFENVKVVLSGMSTLDQIKENIAYADEMKANQLTQEELDLYTRVKETIDSRAQIPCTDCKYCMPCPEGVNIPGNFKLYNLSYMYEDVEARKETYQNKFKAEQKANACVACGACIPKCPQNISIIEDLKRFMSALYKQGLKTSFMVSLLSSFFIHLKYSYDFV